MSFCTTSRWYAGVEAPPIAAAIAPLLADVEAPPIADVEAPPIADVETPAIRFAADCIPPAQNSPPRSSEWTLTAGTSLTRPDARSGRSRTFFAPPIADVEAPSMGRQHQSELNSAACLILLLYSPRCHEPAVVVLAIAQRPTPRLASLQRYFASRNAVGVFRGCQLPRPP